jgi:fluoroacetyl-CoA thioesterase
MPDLVLEPGATRSEEIETKASDGVTHTGPVAMLSTPDMIRMMERVCLAIMQEHLEPPKTSVGTRVDVRHLAAARAGDPVRIEAAYLRQEGRRYVFEVRAFSGEKKIGEGFHERAVIDPSRFQSPGDGKS